MTSAAEVKRGRGRPAQGGPVVAGVLDGRGVAWCDGQFAGDADVLVEVRATVAAFRRVFLGGRVVQAGTQTPQQAVAAILTAGVSVVRAPEPLLVAARKWAEAAGVPQ